MRVMLDTNLWSSIGDEGVTRSFDALMASRGFEVLVAPSTLVEVVQLPVADARQRIIAALATGPRRRLPTEAQSESMEVVSEARRARPQWIRRMPDTARVASLNAFWTRRVWRQAVADSQWMHDYQVRQRGVYEHVVVRQREQRAELIRTNTFRIRPLTALTATPSPDAPAWYLAGWSGEPVEPWRIECRDVYWHALAVVGGRAFLTREDATFADWIGAFLDLRRLRSNREEFTRFWLHDVDRAVVPRNWLRWAVRLAQASYKVTGGNPADEQHSSYLVDSDLFLTADERYVAVLDVVRSDAPFPIAEPRLVNGDRTVPVLDRLAAAL